MICPFRLIGRPIGDVEFSKEHHACLTKDCAWWIAYKDGGGTCAMNELALQFSDFNGDDDDEEGCDDET
ncbi:MAG: hypothetical protein AMS21_01095 [Gemmatimonas sp. SG8_38_2]|nr:MAG: hypothetical protein AMS21_01095 [Gemmatimonas sp. SG8_38_2]